MIKLTFAASWIVCLMAVIAMAAAIAGDIFREHLNEQILVGSALILVPAAVGFVWSWRRW